MLKDWFISKRKLIIELNDLRGRPDDSSLFSFKQKIFDLQTKIRFLNKRLELAKNIILNKNLYIAKLKNEFINEEDNKIDTEIKLNYNDVKAIDKNAQKKYKAFSNDNTDYYILMQDLDFLKAGAIFYHDRDDSVRGSIGAGCLKLCWTPDGNCYSGLCGDTVVFHAEFKNTTLFSRM